MKCASFVTLTLTLTSVSRSMEDIHSPHAAPDTRPPFRVLDDQPSGSALKRRPSPSFQEVGNEISRKRLREDQSEQTSRIPVASSSKYDTFVEDLAQELQCGCCAELVYRPVVVSPCQHFFCGRYSHTTYPECALADKPAAAVFFGSR